MIADVNDLSIYLRATNIIDSDNPDIVRLSRKLMEGSQNERDLARRLFIFVRDRIIYDPYTPFFLPEHFRASNVLKRGRGFCIHKASLLCALLRASGIPCRIRFATVRNHLATEQLLEFLGSDIFPYHAYVEIFLSGKWVKATPAFNRELCERFKVPPLDFDGENDAIFQAYNLEERKFMEYVEFLGVYDDIPVEQIVRGFEEAYGEERVRMWRENYMIRGSLR